MNFDLAPSSVYLSVLISTLPWLGFSWIRLRWYARMFQLEEYDIERYSIWFDEAKNSQRYQLLSFVFVLLLAILACSVTVFEESRSHVREHVIVYSWLAAFLVFYLTPRGQELKQKIPFTERTVRLLVTASIIEFFLILFSALIIWALLVSINDPNKYFMSPIPTLFSRAIVVIAATLGVVVYAFVPFSLPIANWINWPIERIFRRS